VLSADFMLKAAWIFIRLIRHQFGRLLCISQQKALALLVRACDTRYSKIASGKHSPPCISTGHTTHTTTSLTNRLHEIPQKVRVTGKA
jgi:hypothetical protein